MPCLEEGRFLTELNKARPCARATRWRTLSPLASQLYERNKASGSVWVTMKRSALLRCTGPPCLLRLRLC